MEFCSNVQTNKPPYLLRIRSIIIIICVRFFVVTERLPYIFRVAVQSIVTELLLLCSLIIDIERGFFELLGNSKRTDKNMENILCYSLMFLSTHSRCVAIL